MAWLKQMGTGQDGLTGLLYLGPQFSLSIEFLDSPLHGLSMWLAWASSQHGGQNNQTSYMVAGLPGGSVVQILPVIQEIWIRSLGWEDPLEKGMATHSSILAWRIPWTDEPGWL